MNIYCVILVHLIGIYLDVMLSVRIAYAFRGTVKSRACEEALIDIENSGKTKKFLVCVIITQDDDRISGPVKKSTWDPMCWSSQTSQKK